MFHYEQGEGSESKTQIVERERDLLSSDFRLVKSGNEMRHERTLGDYAVEDGETL